MDIMLKLIAKAEELVGQPEPRTPQPTAEPRTSTNKAERIGKLLLLDLLAPLCARERTTHVFLLMVDPAQFEARAKEWGVWQMSEETFSLFEEQKMQEFTKTLSVVSPAFPLTVFAHVESILKGAAKAEKKRGEFQPSSDGSFSHPAILPSRTVRLMSAREGGDAGMSPMPE